MPNALIKSFAKKSGKSVKELEKMWDALADAYDPKKYDDKYSFIVGVMKKNLKLDENSSFDKLVIEVIKKLSA